MKTKSSVFLTLLFLCGFVDAQTPPYFKLGKDEFTNTDIYTLFYDDVTDILYAGTDRGLFSCSKQI